MTTKKELLQLAEKDYRADIVALNPATLTALAQHLSAEGAPEDVDYWYALEGPKLDLEQAATFWAVFASQAFRFWRLTGNGEKDKLHYACKTGSPAMLALIGDCWRHDLPEHPFESEAFISRVADLPGAADRIRIAEELDKRWGLFRDQVFQLVRATRQRALTVEDAGALAVILPVAFGDPYLKKAQLAVAAIAGLSRAQGEGVATPPELTAMADYQVPRVLRALNGLSYSPELERKVSAHELLQRDGREERAIRAATVLAVENISAQSGYSSLAVDNLLWQSQSVAGSERFHLTETDRY